MRQVSLVLAILGSHLLFGPSGFAAPGDLTLISTSDAGTKGNASSSGGGLSSDGTKVAFSSNATNLHPADTDSTSDAYVKDVPSGETLLVSTSDAGVKGNASSGAGDLSSDGTKVVISSSATNLDPADVDSSSDVYVKDVVTGNITLASTSDAGVKGNADSLFGHLSADGMKVAFSSSATNLDSADTDAVRDVYVKNLLTGDITLASTSDAGAKGTEDSSIHSLSADGTVVAFTTTSSLDPGDERDVAVDVYVKNIVTGDVTLASTDDSGQKVRDAMSIGGSLSADGTRVAFISWAALDPADRESFPFGNSTRDTYVKDLSTGNAILASASDTGDDGVGNSWDGYVSADGTSVAFTSRATNLDPADTDFIDDVYVKNIVTGDITLASISRFGLKGDQNSLASAISADGSKLAFSSVATNLHPSDTDSTQDVYVKEPGGPPGVPPCPTGSFFDDLEPAAEPGWTFDVARNDSASPTWAAVVDPLAHSPTHSFNTDAVAPAIKDDRLISPSQDLSSTSRLIFWHRFNFENGFDGGVLEVSIDGGATWSDILSGGGSFLAGGYNGTINTGFQNPIGGREAWTGASASVNAMTRVEVLLGAFAGLDVRVRWRMGADNRFVTSGTGWWVDDIQFTNLALNCPPLARDDFASTVNGIPVTINVLANDSEPNGDTMTVTGVTQPANGTAVINPNQTVTYDPVCAFQGTDTFTYTVSDGQGGTDTATVSVRARKTSRRGSIPC
jgi:hypothetical protein